MAQGWCAGGDGISPPAPAPAMSGVSSGSGKGDLGGHSQQSEQTTAKEPHSRTSKRKQFYVARATR